MEAQKRLGEYAVAFEKASVDDFEGGCIRHLEDRYREGVAEHLMQYLRAHGAKLHPVRGPG